MSTKNVTEAKIVSLCPWSIICLAIPLFLVTNSIDTSHGTAQEKTTKQSKSCQQEDTTSEKNCTPHVSENVGWDGTVAEIMVGCHLPQACLWLYKNLKYECLVHSLISINIMKFVMILVYVIVMDLKYLRLI